jgi:hypothetical protein
MYISTLLHLFLNNPVNFRDLQRIDPPIGITRRSRIFICNLKGVHSPEFPQIRGDDIAA